MGTEPVGTEGLISNRNQICCCSAGGGAPPSIGRWPVLAWSKTWVVPPAAARRGRQGRSSIALKRHLVVSSPSPSCHPVMSSWMSLLQQRGPQDGERHQVLNAGSRGQAVDRSSSGAQQGLLTLRSLT